jgi:hypothetical protein
MPANIPPLKKMLADKAARPLITSFAQHSRQAHEAEARILEGHPLSSLRCRLRLVPQRQHFSPLAQMYDVLFVLSADELNEVRIGN